MRFEGLNQVQHYRGLFARRTTISPFGGAVYSITCVRVDHKHDYAVDRIIHNLTAITCDVEVFHAQDMLRTGKYKGRRFRQLVS